MTWRVPRLVSRRPSRTAESNGQYRANYSGTTKQVSLLKSFFDVSITLNLSETIMMPESARSRPARVAERTRKLKFIRRSTMTKSGFSYLKLTAVGAGLAITLIGLSGLLSVATIAQEE